jgi:hypothetical protein
MDAASLKKGGARKLQVPKVAIDLVQLETIMKDESNRSMWNFGLYNGIQKAQAANGQGLLQNKEFLGALVKVTDGTTVLSAMGELRPIMKVLMDEKAALNSSKYNNLLFAGQKATNITTMLTHLRRLAREPLRWAQVKQSLVLSQVSSLQELVDLVSIDGLNPEGLSIDLGEETKRSPKKILKREVSLDDDGLPCYLSKIGPPASSSSGASSSSPTKLDAYYLKALQQVDPDFVEEAYQTAASYHAKAMAADKLQKGKMAADKLQKENLNQELEKKKKPRNTKVASPAKPAQAAKEMAPKKNVLKKHNKKKTVKKHKKKNMKQVIEATKKPATSSTPSVQQLDQAEDATICYSDHIMEYKLEKYSKAGSVGIRRMFGDKKQIFSLRNNNWSFAQLLELGQLVTTKLKEELAGKKCSEASEVAIKAFAMSRLKHSE